MAYPRVTERVEQAEAGLQRSGKAATTAGVTPELVKVLAAQIVLEKQKDAQAAINRQLETNPKTIAAQQLEAMGINEENSIQNKVAGVRGALQHKEGQQQQRLAQVGQGATPPQQVANAGIASAPRPPMRMAQGGVIGFQSGGGISDEEIAKASDMSLADFLKLDPSIQESYRSAVKQEIDPKSSGFTRFLAKQQRNLANLRQQGITAGKQRTGADKIYDWFTQGAEERATAEKQDTAAAQQLKMLDEARKGQTEIPVAGSPIVSDSSTDGGVGYGRWGGPEHEADVFGAAPAALPKPPPPLPRPEDVIAGAERTEIVPQTAGVAALVPEQKSIFGADEGGVPQVALTDRPLREDAVQGFTKLTQKDPTKAYEATAKRAQDAYGRTKKEDAAEQARQGAVGRFDAQLDRPGKQQQDRAMAFLAAQARNPMAGPQGYSEKSDQQTHAMRNRMFQRHNLERDWTASGRKINKDIHDSAEASYKKAEDLVVKGFDGLAAVDAKDVDMLNENARNTLQAKIANRTSFDARLKMTMLAAMDAAGKELSAQIAEGVQETAQLRMQLEVALEDARGGRLDAQAAETLIQRTASDLAKHTLAFEKMFVESFQQLDMLELKGKEKKKKMEALTAKLEEVKIQALGPIASSLKMLKNAQREKNTTATPRSGGGIVSVRPNP